MKVELGNVQYVLFAQYLPPPRGSIPDGSHARIYCSAQSFRPYMTVPSSGFSRAERKRRERAVESDAMQCEAVRYESAAALPPCLALPGPLPSAPAANRGLLSLLGSGSVGGYGPGRGRSW